MSHSLDAGGAPSEVAGKQAAADPRSAKKATLVRDVLYALALLLCIGLAVYVFQNVPLDTRLPNNGRRGREGTPVPYAMLMPPVVMMIIWWVGRRRPLRPGKSGLIRRYVFAALIPLAAVTGQALAVRSLIEVGALGG